MTEQEKEFIASFRALLTRYEVEIKTENGWDGILWCFTSQNKDIDVTMEEIHTEIVQ
jgi:hypothetical protein